MLRKMIIILLVYVFFGLCFAQDSLWKKNRGRVIYR